MPVANVVSIPERVLEALKPSSIENSLITSSKPVSIPERVLEALKRQRAITSHYLQLVSIPERVLEALKPLLGLPVKI